MAQWRLRVAAKKKKKAASKRHGVKRRSGVASARWRNIGHGASAKAVIAAWQRASIAAAALAPGAKAATGGASAAAITRAHRV